MEIATVAAVMEAAVDIRSQIPFSIIHGVPLFGPRGDPPFGADMIRHATIFGGRVILGIAIAKSFRKDLIPDGMLGPVEGGSGIGG